MYARLYAKVVGVTIVLIGVGGVLLVEKSLFGVLNIDIAERRDSPGHPRTDSRCELSRLGQSRAFGGRRSGSGVPARWRPWASQFPDLFGLLPHEYHTVLDNLIHLSLGVLGLTVGFFLGPRPVAQS